MRSLQGYLLVASPHLPDPNFYRTVVLIIQHDEEGAFGVVLNRYADCTLADIVEGLDNEIEFDADYVHSGGPVPGPILAIHKLPTCSDSEIMPGVFLATQHDYVHTIVSDKDEPYRVMMGYSGWAGGQLEDEIDQGGWLFTKASVEDIFSSPECIWKRVTQRIGLEVLSPGIKPRLLAADPMLN